jgi:hypothetical protein
MTGISELIFLEQLMDFDSCPIDTPNIIGIHDENETLCILEKMAPESVDVVLSTNILNAQIQFIIFNCLDIEPDRWGCGDVFTKLEFGQNCCLPCCIQAKHDKQRVS